MTIQFFYNISDPDYPYARCVYEYNPDSKNIKVNVQTTIKLKNNIFSDLKVDSRLIINYTRFKENVTLANGEIFISDEFNNTLGLIEYASIYNDDRSTKNIFYNVNITITFPISNATGIFAGYKNGKVVIEYSDNQRIISVFK